MTSTLEKPTAPKVKLRRVRKHSAAPPHQPKPPRRVTPSMVPRAPLTRSQVFVQGISTMVAALLFGFLVNLLLLSHLQHLVSQQQLSNSFRAELEAGTAPVSEGTFDNVLLGDGTPIAMLTIPSIGVHEVVVEGTNSGDLKSGPGHRRDTVLPGQVGVSVIMGRAAAYGGPFSRIQELPPGEVFSVFTGQGRQTFKVIGVRYAGDLSPAAPKTGESRLILETARGPAYIPSGVAYVDAELVRPGQPAGARQTTAATLAPEQKEMATDTTTAWAVVLGLQLFLVAEIAAVWALRRVGARKMWVVFVPVLLLASILVSDGINRFLPNLL